jgi:AraC family transcriptional regulator
MRITGLLAGESAEIPAAWQRFAPYAGGRTAYGVCAAEGYLCGVEGELAGDWTEIRLEPARYLVFRHRGHVSTIRKTWFTIWNRGVAEAGCRVTGAPEFERYGKEFDGRTGNGGLEIWVPVEG